MKLPQRLTENDAFHGLVEDCQAIYTEYGEQGREIVLRCAYAVGEAINVYIEEYSPPIGELLKNIADTMGKKVRQLDYCREFHMHVYRDYTNDFETFLLKLPKGAGFTWVIKNRLTEGGGRNNTPPESADIIPPSLPPSNYEENLSLPCPICGKTPVEKAHYPTTIGAGAAEDEWIPLCSACHREHHAIGFVSWFTKYGRKLFKEFIYPIFRTKFKGD